MKNTMASKKQGGFTLIELVIVIVIIGILTAVAAPRFVGLEGKAKTATLKSLSSSLESATTVAYASAVFDGKGSVPSVTAGGVTGYPTVSFVYGYPTAKPGDAGIFGALGRVPSAADFKITDFSGNTVPNMYVQVAGDPTPASTSKCMIKYTQATASAPAQVTSDFTGCN